MGQAIRLMYSIMPKHVKPGKIFKTKIKLLFGLTKLSKVFRSRRGPKYVESVVGFI